MSEHLTKDAIDLSTLSIPRLFGRYFLPTLFGMISISAMCAIDGIFVGHAVGADGIGAINICVPIMMLATGLGLMTGAGCSANFGDIGYRYQRPSSRTSASVGRSKQTKTFSNNLNK
ncbi:hypothetical protein [Leyella stercorea]|uniref:hypothetical protein n=1 Tax=Leyella stercorea TaxID=363265 RepID=UPI001F2A9EA7|nr:hypothetical protein [Leyella stercorea]MCF2615290.1 hypothetical protein [Leyella stercorea]